MPRQITDPFGQLVRSEEAPAPVAKKKDSSPAMLGDIFGAEIRRTGIIPICLYLGLYCADGVPRNMLSWGELKARLLGSGDQDTRQKLIKAMLDLYAQQPTISEYKPLTLMP